MTTDILAFGMVGGFEWLIVLLVFVGIPALLIVFFFKYLSRGSKERQKLRLELGKLADELEQVRKQAESGRKEDPRAES